MPPSMPRTASRAKKTRGSSKPASGGSATKKSKSSRPPSKPKAAAGKGDGDDAVKAYIAALPGWKKAIAVRIDGIIQREVPGVRRAVKWHVPFYGVEGQGWFAAFSAFTNHVNLAFFRGTALKPVPPSGEQKDARALDVREEDKLDEEQVASWVRQAAAIPGFLGGR